jgi:hypothetical protein
MGEFRREIPDLDLVAAPAVHTQGLDLRNMGAELAMQCSTSYAKEYAQLVYCKLQTRGVKRFRPVLHSSLPILQSIC